ncbi:ABC transporter ATP-binding protein/permease [Novosphingobium sp. KCTC 2891]|uniref:ABC transporter ATP-binding protein n=1 Tax=Novosphingobium sp. KCTC 2891 TaxID=2989730 RepID=UPI002222C481|nr:ABC transporter ATP-binding protein [Novosphingobium sp. KCTC 2891]MCW1383275.1 ABC transporter ATP-binding protein/permease [Novosphingobium sp. KCTC 2891]
MAGGIHLSGTSDGEQGPLPSGVLFGSARLAPILRPYWRYFPVVSLLGLVAAVLESVGVGALIPLIALMMAETVPASLPAPVVEIARVAHALPTPQRAYALIATVMALIGLKSLVHAANNLLVARLHAAISRDILDAMARRTIGLDFAFFLNGQGGRAFNALARSSWWVFEAVRAALQIVQAGASAMVFAAILLWLDWRLSLVASAGALVIAGVLALMDRMQRRQSILATATSEELLRRSREIVDGARVIRLFGQEAREQDRFQAETRATFRGYRSLNAVAGLVAPSFDFLIACVFIAILFTAYALGTSMAQVTAFLLLILRAQPQVGQISHARSVLASQAGPIGDAEWLLGQPLPPETLADARPVGAIDLPVVFDRVRFAYPDGTLALDDVSFAIAPGSVTALIGKSGAGKSTVINLLCGLVPPLSGEVRFGDTPLDQLRMKEWRGLVAVAGQDVGLFGGTVRDNIAYGCPGANDADILGAAAAAGAAGFIAALPQGLDAWVGDTGSNLSGGQRQRIALARALLKRPDLLILDEATNAVDALTEKEVMALLHERRFFRTALVISHRASTLEACTAAIVLDEGRVVEAGPLRETSYLAAMAGGPA